MLRYQGSRLWPLSLRTLCLLAVWWALTLGEPSALGFGLVVAVLAAWLSVLLFPPSGYRLSLPGLVRFAGYFLVKSLTAGLDVARRLLKPVVDVHPGQIRVRLRLPDGSPRWLLANTLSLMPGTLSVRFEGEWLWLHCLDTRQAVIRDVRTTEARVATVFGLSLSEEEAKS
ncbi:Na+/H+ antiporter subunit E [Marinobacter daepoensis]|uniref:Na+/H+ antiporter subunit E n=1 Tax=Marinobacter daepoensis TaxID=262077 RepID=UPI001C94C8C5|nr:Na+/H+ antiporter subunit E [Marinobacter daepoensis]MBY6033187.1 Na+/H+ antiporter subunit E [Marinobacter daepoensis]